MKLKQFLKNFAGAFIGVIIYKLFFEIPDTFNSYWTHFLVESLVIGACIFVTLLLINFISGDISSSKVDRHN